MPMLMLMRLRAAMVMRSAMIMHMQRHATL